MRLNNQKGDRRREPRVTARYDARVEVGAATLEREIGTVGLGPLTLHGHTRDLSPSGLGVVIPAVDTGPRHRGGPLPARVKIELAGRGVEVKAEAVHWTPLGEMGLGRGVLIGMRIVGGGAAAPPPSEQRVDVAGEAADPKGSGQTEGEDHRLGIQSEEGGPERLYGETVAGDLGRRRQFIWRRGAPRMEVPLPAFWGPAEDDCAGVAIARGLSRRGCFVEALVDELRDEAIFLRVLLPTGRRLALRAEVAYYIKGQGIGAAFTGLSAEDAAMIDLLAEYYEGE
jgi:hypothetical protein